MKNVTLICFILLSFSGIGQSLIGAWGWSEMGEDGRKVNAVVTFTEGFQVAAWFDAETGAFIETNGGSWELNGNTMTEVAEFNSADSSKVGVSSSFEIEFDGNDRLRIVGTENWATRVDAGKEGELAGAWLMSGRKRNGEMQERNTSLPRKTMKILSGTRFQWIAYNTATKQFMGTGGGNYTTIDGKYTENIEFFSRDDSRVGASLEFNYELKDGAWHHSGFSSKGDPLYEVWSLRD